MILKNINYYTSLDKKGTVEVRSTIIKVPFQCRSTFAYFRPNTEDFIALTGH